MPTFRSRNKNIFTFKNKSSQSIVKEINDLINEHIISEQQQELVETYSRALRNDVRREQEIKRKITKTFINMDSKFSKKDYFSDLKQSLNDTGSIDLRNKLTTKMKKSFSGSKTLRRSTVMTPIFSSRYESGSNNHTQSLKSKNTANSNRVTKSFNYSKESMFSLQLDDIITESRKSKSKTSKMHRRIVTATQRNQQSETDYNNQKQFIISKIIENDIDEYLKNYELAKELPNPEQIKKIYEQKKSTQLSNLEKYSMSFTNYMRQKTYENIEKTVYNDKIRQKESFLEKFQSFVLTQLKFSEEVRRRLQKIFKNIELEFRQQTKKRQSSSRIIK